MKLTKKVFAIIISAALALSMAACSSKPEIAATNGNFSVPVGVYTYYAYYTYRGLAQNGQIDPTKSLKSQTIAEKPAIEYINEAALDNLRYMIQLEEEYTKALAAASTEEQKAILEITDAQKNILALENDDSTSATNGASLAGTQYAQEKDFYEKNGVAKDSIVLASLDGGLAGFKQQKLFEYNYGANGVTPVTDEELKAYYASNYVYFSYISVPTENTSSETAATEEENAAIKTAALAEMNTLKADLQSGKKNLTTVVEEYAAKGTGYSALEKQSVPVSQGSELLTQIAALKDNEYAVLENSGSAYLVVKHAAAESKYLDNEDNKANMISDLKIGDFQQKILDDAKASKTIVIDHKVLAKFGVEKLKITGQAK
ncbi:MAG: hypothetical protein LBS74_01545 [Oscillospiraceae bacterium]|jgi:hypothetical protein|nr:hypothetical protein [Oscillospiraceae bacterium]